MEYLPSHGRKKKLLSLPIHAPPSLASPVTTGHRKHPVHWGVQTAWTNRLGQTSSGRERAGLLKSVAPGSAVALHGSWDPITNPLNQKLWAVPSNVFNQPMRGSEAPKLLAYLLKPDYHGLMACFCHLKPITQNPPGLTSFNKIGMIMIPALLRLI